MLLRFDPFREIDRTLDEINRRAPSVPFDAVRRGGEVIIYFDLPGVDPDAVDLTVERDVLTLRAERRYQPREDEEVIASERRQGTFSRQLFLGDMLDTSAVQAKYEHGVLVVSIPLARQAQPRRVSIDRGDRGAEEITPEGG